MKVLVVNSGSSSVKCCLFKAEDLTHPLWKAQASWAVKSGCDADCAVEVTYDDKTDKFEWRNTDVKTAIGKCLFLLRESGVIQDSAELAAIGHRVVHGGSKYSCTTAIDSKVLADIEELTALAPSHQPKSIAGIKVAQEEFPQAKQFAAFDTAYHQTIPAPRTVYAGPYEWYTKGIRRYGFHGINHKFCAGRAAQILGQPLTSLRIITCHLGSGCSITATAGGTSQMTTMGYTPLEGMIMRTRSGSIDPGIIFHLLQENAYDAKALEKCLNRSSGLKGISGLSGDMRELLKAMDDGHAQAKLAFDAFIESLCFNISALLPAIGGLDALIFTGGIGENAYRVRQACCDKLAFLNIRLDQAANQSGAEGLISPADALVKCLTIKAAEEAAIAADCLALV